MRYWGDGGFTLIELIVATAVMSIVGLILLNFFTDSLVNYRQSEARVALQSNTRQATDVMALVIRSAEAVEEHNSIADASQPGGWVSDGDTLILATPALDSAKAPIYTDAAHSSVYTNNTIFYVSNDVIYKWTVANPNAPGNAAVTTCPPESATPSCPADPKVVEDVATLSVDYGGIDPDLVQSVKLTLTRFRTVFSKTLTSTVTSTVALRNK